MTILENLWYGNIHPVEEFLEGNKEYKTYFALRQRIRKDSALLYPPSKPYCLRNTNRR